MNKINEVIIFENQDVKLEVNMNDETVWLNQDQMVKLFEKDQSVISRHINNVFKEHELDKKSNMQKMHIPNSDKPINLYSLDVIISVGYRVKSQRGTQFRKWANKILKDHLIKGYSVNQQRLEYLEKTVKLLDIATRVDRTMDNDEAIEILKIISSYSNALNLLDDYDHGVIKKKDGTHDERKITYHDCNDIILKLRFNEESDIFALERSGGLESIINNIYQTFDGDELYKTTEEKAANFLYMIIKNHVYVDGNKRIAATLFIYFMNYYGILNKEGIRVISNNTLTALTLLIAQSNPSEKEIIINLIMSFIVR